MSQKRRLSLEAALLKDVALRVRDLSAGGCLLESSAYLPIGTIGVLDIEFEGARRVEWFRVCRVEVTDDRAGACFVGVEFLPLATAGTSSLRGAVRRVDETRALPPSAGTLSGDPANSVAAASATRRTITKPAAESPARILHFDRASALDTSGRRVAEPLAKDAPVCERPINEKEKEA
jgi:hypothetical protein